MYWLTLIACNRYTRHKVTRSIREMISLTKIMIKHVVDHNRYKVDLPMSMSPTQVSVIVLRRNLKNQYTNGTGRC